MDLQEVKKYQDWSWKVKLTNGQIDFIDLHFTLFGREDVYLNTRKIYSKYCFGMKNEISVTLSDGSKAVIQIKQNEKKRFYPDALLVCKGSEVSLQPSPENSQAKDPLYVQPEKYWNYIIYPLCLILLLGGGVIGGLLAGYGIIKCYKYMTDAVLEPKDRLKRSFKLIAILYLIILVIAVVVGVVRAIYFP